MVIVIGDKHVKYALLLRQRSRQMEINRTLTERHLIYLPVLN